MKKFMLITTVIIGLLFSSPVSEERALELAENFFFYRNNPNSSEFIVESIQTYSKNNEDIFYVIKIEPVGFILISANNLIRPILAYSFENDYRDDNIPVNIEYLFNLYSEELQGQKENTGAIEIV